MNAFQADSSGFFAGAVNRRHIYCELPPAFSGTTWTTRKPRRLSSRRKAGSICGGLRFGVVKQHDAAAGVLDARQDQAQLLLRAHGQPVARPDVGAEHHDPARRQAIEQGRVGGKAGKAEERRRRLGRRLAVDGGFVRRDAAVDLGFRPRQCHAVEQRVGVAVMAERMALGQCTPRELRVGGGVAAEQEERGAHAFVP